ncbi:MAG: ferritin-like protein [Gloeotrichia echinulata HAB0833]
MNYSKRQVISSQPQLLIEKICPSSGEDTGETVNTLQTMLQQALIIEFFTIPPYLTALYSIKDKTSQAYQTIRTVVLEEMLHINLVCNLMNSIRVTPKFVGKVLSYPNPMPFSVAGGVFVQLLAASPELMEKTFMVIEQPAPLDAEWNGNACTIGQFYQAIKYEFEKLPSDFQYHLEGQRDNLYFGSGGGKAILVNSLDKAEEAIEQIMQQGEGAKPPSREYNPDQPWGTYNHYGIRTDKTYGPILGTPFDMSHFFKFKDLADSTIPIGETYPMLPNPSPEKFDNPWAKELGEVFKDCYGLLIRALEETFAPIEQTNADPYFVVIVPLMQSIFTTLATTLMQIPVLENSDATLGPNAGPCFQYSTTPLNEIITKVSDLLNSPPNQDANLQAILKTILKSLEDMNKKGQELSLKCI